MDKTTYLKRKATYLTEGQIDRRSFVKSALAAGVALPAALSLADKAQAMTPKKGGLFRNGMGYGSTTDVLDPATAENSFSTQVIYTRGNHLAEVDNDGVLKPELAESYEASDGAARWVFDLRQGVHSFPTRRSSDHRKSVV